MRERMVELRFHVRVGVHIVPVRVTCPRLDALALAASEQYLDDAGQGLGHTAAADTDDVVVLDGDNTAQGREKQPKESATDRGETPLDEKGLYEKEIIELNSHKEEMAAAKPNSSSNRASFSEVIQHCLTLVEKKVHGVLGRRLNALEDDSECQDLVQRMKKETNPQKKASLRIELSEWLESRNMLDAVRPEHMAALQMNLIDENHQNIVFKNTEVAIQFDRLERAEYYIVDGRTTSLGLIAHVEIHVTTD